MIEKAIFNFQFSIFRSKRLNTDLSRVKSPFDSAQGDPEGIEGSRDHQSLMTVAPGFTFIEMLVAVTIFSGLLILALATFSRSIASSNKVSVLRQKSETARSVIDQITTDFNFVYKDKQVTDKTNGNFQFTGYYFWPLTHPIPVSGIVMVLKYPGEVDSNGQSKYTRKEYDIAIRTLGGHGQTTTYDLQMREDRDCNINSGNELDCGATAGDFRFITSDQYLIDKDSSIAGLTIDDGNNPPVAGDPKQTGYVSLNLIFRPAGLTADDQNLPCFSSDSSVTTLPVATCYKISTTLNAGVI
jgi:prepilin-type N-terminal cleavage/methylation domain-containing protein